ncbi:MAG: hypothetical protein JXA13_10295 [Anaerolineales bacterium]|nr:hypothetical protein [Anaerolineales bacterium]
MTLDQAIEKMQSVITGASSGAVIRVVKMSDEEARLSVYAPNSDLNAIKEACFQPTMDFLTREGLDLQVFPYDLETTPPPE